MESPEVIINQILHDVERRYKKRVMKGLTHALQNDNPFERRSVNISNLPDDIEFSSPTDTGRVQHTYLTGEDYHTSHERNYEGPKNMSLPKTLVY